MPRGQIVSLERRRGLCPHALIVADRSLGYWGGSLLDHGSRVARNVFCLRFSLALNVLTRLAIASP